VLTHPEVSFGEVELAARIGNRRVSHRVYEPRSGNPHRRQPRAGRHRDDSQRLDSGQEADFIPAALVRQ